MLAPAACSRHFIGRTHLLAGRFVPADLAKKYELDRLPSFSGLDIYVDLRATPANGNDWDQTTKGVQRRGDIDGGGGLAGDEDGFPPGVQRSVTGETGSAAGTGAGAKEVNRKMNNDE